MAFNCADTRQRAYRSIDTSAPGGSWIDEKAFNKSLAAKTADGSAHPCRTLVGNWQEETALEGDMLAQGKDLAVLQKTGKYYKGGFESTSYLLSSVPEHDRTMTHVNSTHRTSFNDTNADVSARLAPVGGVRSQLKAKEVIEEAKRMVAESERRSQRAPDPLTTAYRDTITNAQHIRHLSGARRHVHQPEELTYGADVPVTLYTGDPKSGKVMSVHGKTFASGPNPLGRSNAFTHDKFAIGTL